MQVPVLRGERLRINLNHCGMNGGLQGHFFCNCNPRSMSHTINIIGTIIERENCSIHSPVVKTLVELKRGLAWKDPDLAELGSATMCGAGWRSRAEIRIVLWYFHALQCYQGVRTKFSESAICFTLAYWGPELINLHNIPSPPQPHT